MTVIGLDVGYSNLKIAVGEAGGSPRVIVRPAGAAPLDRLGERIGAAPPPGRRRGRRRRPALGRRHRAGTLRGLAALPARRLCRHPGLPGAGEGGPGAGRPPRGGAAGHRAAGRPGPGPPAPGGAARCAARAPRHRAGDGRGRRGAHRAAAGRRLRRPAVVGSGRGDAGAHRGRHRAGARCRLLLLRLGARRGRGAAPGCLGDQPGGDVGAAGTRGRAHRRAARRPSAAARPGGRPAPGAGARCWCSGSGYR